VGVRVNLILTLVAGEDLVRHVAEHFIHVHVKAGVTAALPEIERELLIVRTVKRLIGGFSDRFRDLRIESADRGVSAGGSLLDMSHRAENVRIENDRQVSGARHLLHAGRLNAVVTVIRDFHFTEAVTLNAGISHSFLLRNLVAASPMTPILETDSQSIHRLH